MSFYGTKITNVALRGLGFFCLLFAVFCSVAEGDENLKHFSVSGLPQEEALRLGERIYREGILPSGVPMEAIVKGDIPVAGTAFSCESCHMRSGLGSIEGRVVTPPTNGKKLFQPLKTVYKNVVVDSMPHRRPAYTDESLADVLRGGVDPSGRLLNDIMPRYMLDDRDMAILIYYLKSLSSQFSPGVTDSTLRMAAIISEDVNPAERDVMLANFEDYFKYRNASAKAYGVGKKRSRMTETMLGSREAAYLDLKLSLWVLKGPPDTWRGQLEEYYRTDPVFALIGGITTSEWKPIHDFSEAHRIPGLFPFTSLPVISETGWYTLYLSKGLYQEGESAARYLSSQDVLINGRIIVEIVRDSQEGRALSAGFRETLRDMGNNSPLTITLKEEETLTAEKLQQVLAGEQPAAVIIWDGPKALPALETLPDTDKRPGMIFVSSGYLGNSIWTLKEELRDFTYITYPFRLPQDETKLNFSIPFIRNTGGNGDEQLIHKRTYAVIQILELTLMDLKGEYYRDRFLDIIGMMPDQKVPLYERLSFGPGQRYASKGCYIVQLSKGPNPQLTKRSDWVIH